MRSVEWRTAGGKHHIGSRDRAYIEDLYTKSVKPSWSLSAKPPMKASPDLAARFGADSIDDAVIEAQLSCGGGEIASHMVRFGEAYNQQFHWTLTCSGIAMRVRVLILRSRRNPNVIPISHRPNCIREVLFVGHNDFGRYFNTSGPHVETFILQA